MKTTPLSGLYLVTPDWDDTDQLVALSEIALQNGAAILQYRHKTAPPEQRLQQAWALADLCQRLGKLFIINDHLDLCKEVNADGLHVGGTDMSVAQARAELGPYKIIGASCYGDLQLARDAKQQGASYVAFGGFYPSRVKKYAVTTQADIVSQAKQELQMPVVVIGGMTALNSAPLVRQGSDMVAAISSVYMADNVADAAKEFVRLFLRDGK